MAVQLGDPKVTIFRLNLGPPQGWSQNAYFWKKLLFSNPFPNPANLVRNLLEKRREKERMASTPPFSPVSGTSDAIHEQQCVFYLIWFFFVTFWNCSVPVASAATPAMPVASSSLSNNARSSVSMSSTSMGELVSSRSVPPPCQDVNLNFFPPFPPPDPRLGFYPSFYGPVPFQAGIAGPDQIPKAKRLRRAQEVKASGQTKPHSATSSGPRARLAAALLNRAGEGSSMSDDLARTEDHPSLDTVDSDDSEDSDSEDDHAGLVFTHAFFHFMCNLH